MTRFWLYRRHFTFTSCPSHIPKYAHTELVSVLSDNLSAEAWREEQEKRPTADHEITFSQLEILTSKRGRKPFGVIKKLWRWIISAEISKCREMVRKEHIVSDIYCDIQQTRLLMLLFCWVLTPYSVISVRQSLKMWYTVCVSPLQTGRTVDRLT